MSELSSLAQDLMNDIDIKPLHPKHKVLLYSCYVLSKLFWHFTIANISKTWITELLDSVVNGYIRKWPDIPISGTLSNVFLECNKFVLNICPPSINLLFIVICKFCLVRGSVSSTQEHLQFYHPLRYINHSLPTRKNSHHLMAERTIIFACKLHDELCACMREN